MSLNPVKELGRELGKIKQEQDVTNSNISPDETVEQDQIVSIETLKLGGALSIIKWTYDGESFILDHPVYGELDSSVYKLDGSYGGTLAGFSFPANFPFIFDEGSATSVLLFTTSY